MFGVLIRVRVRVVVCVHWGSLLCESFYIVSWDSGELVVLIRVRVVRSAH